MQFKTKKSDMAGAVEIPGSKSHTIRALFFATLADGVSVIHKPLFSNDTDSAAAACAAMGAHIDRTADGYIIKGTGGKPVTPDDVINTGNSGTTATFAISAAALNDGYTVITGDNQIRRRPQGPLIKSCNDLGAKVVSTRKNGCPPIVVKGRMKGGETKLDGITSQYLSSLLISTPFAEGDSHICMTTLNEVPYVEMTLKWMEMLGLKFKNRDLNEFYIPGKERIAGFDTIIPGDFSSATFFMVLAAISGNEFILKNLDTSDTQGDKAVLEILRNMGAKVTDDRSRRMVTIRGDGLKGLKGIEIDMNAIPDALPALAVAACFAKGETRLKNVPQARLKETDRISAMCSELAKMGADLRELPDGLVIRESNLKGCGLNGYGDHRIVMALTIAGLCSDGETVIDTAEAANVTFPEFAGLIRACGGNLREIL